MLALALLAVAACTDDDDVQPQASFGPDVPVDLAIFFRSNATDDDITNFILEVLSEPPVPGRPGQDHPPGVQYTSGDYSRKAAYVIFFDDADPEDQEALLRDVEADPRVERVEHDVTPSDLPVVP